ncbi:MAG: FKBP-type peptidyl-prolyl cis-trans isomerase [Verrucomicrobia bacterium]|jgi:FKBP-type peptidyl-prolyl cis-trans isomerase FklB|nr:FKBP-type peptidyl-prolyl cis-trans isomerase [Verrucomicrobiota bacterium]
MKMKPTTIVILLGLIAATVAPAEDTKPFKNEKEKVSYAIGMTYGNSFKRMDVDADYDWLLRGIKDGQAGGTALLSESEMREVLMKYQQELTAKQQEKQRQLGEKNRKEGEAFLAANKDKPGIITLASGLQYTILADGDGASPKPEDTVTVNYRGTLLDGTEFDRSPTNQPASFAANGVIRGWTEALTRMKAGSKWKLFIPFDLAYGPMGRQPKIGPNATLLFDVELVSFKSPAPVAATNPNPPLTSDIIKVPSLEEMKKGAKIETIKAEDVDKLQKQQQPAQPDKDKK